MLLTDKRKIVKFAIVLIFGSFLFSQDKLPDTFLKSLDKKKVSIRELHDNGPMAINFWFLACEPCKKEMKYLDEFNQKYAESGFKVVSVNTDNSRTFNRVKPFVDSKKYSFTVLSDPHYKFFRQLGGQQCPYLVLFDEEGKVVAKHAGYNPGDEVKLEKEIIEMISKSSLKDSLAIPGNIEEVNVKNEIEVPDSVIPSNTVVPNTE